MIIPDANLLIYAYDTESPWHEKARAWWEGALNQDEPVGIPWVVVLAFVRLMTHPNIGERPLSVPEVRARVEVWFACPHVRCLPSGESTLKPFFDGLETAGLGGNLSTDALIAAQAIEHGGRVFTTDRDFDRFPELSWTNPLVATG